MGLASALTTALTGLTAAETQIDVIGNNLANSQTVGFKASNTIFATQFLQTQGLGSAPTAGSGGTNPRQIGLGTQTAEIALDFTQGTIEVSANPSDLAIQGNGFFIVEGGGGEQLFTRNGMFKTNSQNQLVTVTGHRLLGYGVDDLFQLQTMEIVPLEIPLGSKSVAQVTQNVTLEGALTPLGDIADQGEIIRSAVLGDGSIAQPSKAGVGVSVSATPDASSVTVTQQEGQGGLHPESAQYQYRFAFVDSSGTESTVSSPVQVTTGGSNGQPDQSIQLNNLPSSANFQSLNIYRTAAGGSDFFLLDNVAMGTASYADHNTVPLDLTKPLNDDTLSGNYSYLATFYREGDGDSRPSPLIGPATVVDGRVHLSNLPVPDPGGHPPYDQVRIWRNTVADPSTYHLVDAVAPGASYTDSKLDQQIKTGPVLDLDGPKADANTLLVNVLRRDGLNYEQAFKEGTLSFTSRKGGRALETKQFTVDGTTTVQDLITFMSEAMGIQQGSSDSQNPIPGSKSTIVGVNEFAPGGSIQAGRIQFVANNGLDNAISIGVGGLQLVSTQGQASSPGLGFGSVQSAKGQSAATDFLVYDSLGTPINVRVTAVMESRTGNSTTYRWFADSPHNDPATGVDISVGTGLVTFDSEGNLINVTNKTVSIDRRNVPSTSPLEFDLDFSQVIGLAVDRATIAASRQDGSPPGTLTSFTIGEDGVIRGSFSNGINRTLGQVRMARFTNPAGLEQRGQNMFAQGPNSGLPVHGDPGENGLGSLIAGAIELSNTDIGQNLIDLVLATTQYRGNTRVITAAQQLLEELMNLRR